MVLKLISATPSPYARKVRIALLEKSIPFQLLTEVPWDNTTQTPQHNPLEKLPVLIDTEASEDDAVYESHFILDWIEYKYPSPEYVALMPQDKRRELFAKKVQVITDGICDACVLMFFEKQRPSPSQEWTARQRRKVDGGLKQLADWIGDKDFLIDNQFSIADIAAGSVLGYLRVRFPEHPWQDDHPNMKAYSDRLEARSSFKQTLPSPQTINDKIV